MPIMCFSVANRAYYCSTMPSAVTGEGPSSTSNWTISIQRLSVYEGREVAEP